MPCTRLMVLQICVLTKLSETCVMHALQRTWPHVCARSKPPGVSGRARRNTSEIPCFCVRMHAYARSRCLLCTTLLHEQPPAYLSTPVVSKACVCAPSGAVTSPKYTMASIALRALCADWKGWVPALRDIFCACYRSLSLGTAYVKRSTCKGWSYCCGSIKQPGTTC